MSRIEWRETTIESVFVQYTEPYESDVARVSPWICRAAKVRARKYELTSYKPPVRLRLHPSPTPRADQHLTMYGYWHGAPAAEIDALTPSADAWSWGGTSLAGLPVDTDDYREKNIVHEFTHAVQVSIWGEPRDTAYPKWWFEGLPEFDGVFCTTAVNRSEASAALVRLVKPRLRKPPVGTAEEIDEALSLDGGYSAGPLFAWFLADQCGEQIHCQLLRGATNAALFWSDLLRMTKTQSPSTLYDKFFDWLAVR